MQLTSRRLATAYFTHPRTTSRVKHLCNRTHSTHSSSNGSGSSERTVAAAPVRSHDAASDGTQSKRAFLIYNPVAGQENPAAILGDIALKLSEKFLLTVVQTKPDLPPEVLAKQALEQQADIVIASGGDGTVGAVAGVLVGTGVPLGIIPRGTANAFSVALGIPTHLDDPSGFHSSAANVILQGYAKDVDTALVTTSEVTDYPMILLLGIGYEAEMCDAADRDLKNALGPLAYIISGAQKLLSARNFKTKVLVDGQTGEGEVAAITVANAAPPFSVLAHGHTGECVYDDGKLEAIGYVAAEGGVTSHVVNVVSMVRLFSGVMFSDKPVQHEERIFGGRYSDIHIECDPPQKVVLDGELLGTTPVHAHVVPASLRVFVPAPAQATSVLANEIAEQEHLDEAVAELPDSACRELVVEELSATATGAVKNATEVEDRPVVAPTKQHG